MIAGKPADARPGVEELLELLAVLIEQRLGARELDRHRDDVGAHDLRVLAQIGVGDDQRILDDRSVCCENSRSRPRSSVTLATTATRIAGTAAMTENSATMRTCSRAAGAAAPARLHHPPDLAADDAEQQQHRQRVDQQERDDDLVGRRDRREVGQHEEGDERRQQRQRDGDQAQQRAPARPGAAVAAAASSAVAAWPTLVI